MTVTNINPRISQMELRNADLELTHTLMPTRTPAPKSGVSQMTHDTRAASLAAGFDTKSKSTLYAGRTDEAKANIAVALAATTAEELDPAALSERFCLHPDCDMRLIRQTLWEQLTFPQRRFWIAAGLTSYIAYGFCISHYTFPSAKPEEYKVDLDYAVDLARANDVMPRQPDPYDHAPTPPPYEVRPWLESAACASTDPEVFHPKTERSSDPAKRICGECPVRDECILSAIRAREKHGVWGGYTRTELHRIYVILDPANGDIFAEQADEEPSDSEPVDDMTYRAPAVKVLEDIFTEDSFDDLEFPGFTTDVEIENAEAA